MDIKIFFFIYFITIVGLTVNGKKYPRKRKMKNCDHVFKRNISMAFDTLVLTISWPPAVCSKHLNSNKKATCKLLPKNQWSIHGLWPSRIARRAPDFCNCSLKYNPDEVATLLPELKEKWADIKNRSDPNYFWNYEWSKHGTCAGSVEALNTQFKYFNQTLKLFDKYNVSKMLSEGGIELRKKPYRQKDIRNAFEKQLGKEIGLNCLPVHVLKKYYLSSVHMCFDKSFNLIDCINNQHYPTNCPSAQSENGEIHFSDMKEMIEEFIEVPEDYDN